MNFTVNIILPAGTKTWFWWKKEMKKGKINKDRKKKSQGKLCTNILPIASKLITCVGASFLKNCRLKDIAVHKNQWNSLVRTIEEAFFISPFHILGQL